MVKGHFVVNLTIPNTSCFVLILNNLFSGVSDEGNPVFGGLPPVVVSLHLSLVQSVHAEPEAHMLSDPVMCLHVFKHTDIPLHAHNGEFHCSHTMPSKIKVAIQCLLKSK